MEHRVKKGINIWSFPQELSLEECMNHAKKAGFEGVELALSESGPVNLKSSESELEAIRSMAQRYDLEINSLATGLYWQYSLTSDRRDIRDRAACLVKKQIDVASVLGADCILVCPGLVGVDFKPEDVVPDVSAIEYFAGCEVIDYDIAYDRALEAFKTLSVDASEKQITIGIENIWNKFLLSPLEMRDFLDKIDSPWVGAFLDVGNMILFGYPEHWIKILGKRIKKVHFKDFRRGTAELTGFVDLLAGDVDWEKVYEAFIQIGYEGWANAEMCPPYKHHSQQLIYNTSAAMDRILHRK